MPGIVAGARGPYPPEDPVLSISADRVAVEGDHKRLPVRTEDHLFAAVGARWSLPGCCLSANHRLPLMPGSDPAAHVGRSYATGRPLGGSLPSNPGSSPGRRCPSTGKRASGHELTAGESRRGGCVFSGLMVRPREIGWAGSGWPNGSRAVSEAGRPKGVSYPSPNSF